jgi:hypothetical protein
MIKIKHNLKASQDRKKIYVDKGRTHKEFKVGDHVFLKGKARGSSMELGNCSKLATHYCGPFEMLERIRPVAYMLALLNQCVFIMYSMYHFLKSMYLMLIMSLIGV